MSYDCYVEMEFVLNKSLLRDNPELFENVFNFRLIFPENVQPYEYIITLMENEQIDNLEDILKKGSFKINNNDVDKMLISIRQRENLFILDEEPELVSPIDSTDSKIFLLAAYFLSKINKNYYKSYGSPILTNNRLTRSISAFRLRGFYEQ